MNIYFGSGGGDIFFMLIAIVVWAIIQGVNRKAQKSGSTSPSSQPSEESTEPVPMNDLGALLESLHHSKPTAESPPSFVKTPQTIAVHAQPVEESIESDVMTQRHPPYVETPEPPPHVAVSYRATTLSGQHDRRQRRLAQVQSAGVDPHVSDTGRLPPTISPTHRKQLLVSLHNSRLIRQTIVAREILGPPLAMRMPAKDPVQS